VIVFLRSVLQLLVSANVLSSLVLVTLMMEALLSSEVLTRATRRNIPKDFIVTGVNTSNLLNKSLICYR
jgi:hypothetical protein